MEKNIAVIWGDCSSPEIVKQTLRVLDKVAEKYGHTFHYTDAAMGGEAMKAPLGLSSRQSGLRSKCRVFSAARTGTHEKGAARPFQTPKE